MFKVGDKVQRSDECFTDYMGHALSWSKELSEMVGEVMDIGISSVWVRWDLGPSANRYMGLTLEYYEHHLKHYVKPITVNTLGQFPRKTDGEV